MKPANYAPLDLSYQVLSAARLAQLIAVRNYLNGLGDASDTVPGNASAWNRRRIRIRNKINARLQRHAGWIA